MIFFGNKKIKEVYEGSSSVEKVFLGNTLIWQKDGAESLNIFDKSLPDLIGYIRYANLSFNTSTTHTNLMARCKVEPNTSYKIELLMDTRFRVFSYKGQPFSGEVISGVQIDPLDDNGTNSIGEVRSITITTGSADNMLYIGYWTSSGALSSEEIRNSIFVKKLMGSEENE